MYLSYYKERIIAESNFHVIKFGIKIALVVEVDRLLLFSELKPVCFFGQSQEKYMLSHQFAMCFSFL